MAEPLTPIPEEEEPLLELKPGWKSSSFWVTVLTVLASLAAASGIIGPETKDRIVAISEDVVFLATALVAGISYNVNRRKLKTEISRLNAQVIETAIIEQGKE